MLANTWNYWFSKKKSAEKVVNAESYLQNNQVPIQG